MPFLRWEIRIALCLLPAIMSTSSFAACEAKSGSATAALVELYTSQGCSSCPPADRRLSSLGRTPESALSVVPLSLHVGYWDYIGWRDQYAQAVFADRHRWLVRTNRSSAAYTPHFFIGGRELRRSSDTLAGRVGQINATPASASIRIGVEPAASGDVNVDVYARVAGGHPNASLYVALTESGLTTDVTRGENRGARLPHDHVVRTWVGPLGLKGGSLRVRREMAVPQAWKRENLAVVAFVQNDDNGTVMQALAARGCVAP